MKIEAPKISLDKKYLTTAYPNDLNYIPLNPLGDLKKLTCPSGYATPLKICFENVQGDQMSVSRNRTIFRPKPQLFSHPLIFMRLKVAPFSHYYGQKPQLFRSFLVNNRNVFAPPWAENDLLVKGLDSI